MKDILQFDSRRYFLLLVRLTFGAWLFYVGLGKWLGGPLGFVGYIEGNFAETWAAAIPGALFVLSWIIIVAEPMLGFLLLTGVSQRVVWSLVAGLMFLLTFGQTILQSHGTVANNWQYLVLAIICAALSDPVEE